MGTLKVKDQTTGLWVYAGTPGPIGPSGPTGPMGVSSVIVGDFGAVTTPADLPPDGLLPVDFDGPGNPAVAYQMLPGQSLYYDKPTDPLDGHLFQYVSTAVSAEGWLDIGLIQGPAGVDGPTGATGPTGPPTDEVYVGPDAPVLPVTELWFDTDDDRLIGPFDLPPGGATYDVLSKETDLDGDTGWRDPHVIPSGKVIQFPNVADVPKLHLYSNTFGLGIESGTMTLFASSQIRFRQNSIAGERWAEINANGLHIDGTLNPATTYNVNWLNGFRGTCDYRVNPAMVTLRLHGVSRAGTNTEVGQQIKMHDYPAGVPAPPGVGSTGYDVLTFTLQGNNFSTDPPRRGVRLHLDATGLWIIPVNDIFYHDDHAIYEVITWAR